MKLGISKLHWRPSAQSSKRYLYSAKVPDARLKIGIGLHELGRMDEAKAMLAKVREVYANSAVSRLADERLVRQAKLALNSG